MTTPRRICVVTGSRADYGLLVWLMREIAADPALQLQIVATGMHFAPEFGLTYREIERDGFVIDVAVEMLLSSDTPVGTAKSIGAGVMGCADALSQLQPDMLVVLGDRFEVFAAAQAAMALRVPIAHIHGGESSEGAIDEAIRHAITKMAHLHFTAAAAYRQRVIQLGEAPERVFNTGAVGLDHLSHMQPLDTAMLERDLQFALRPGPLILCTYHPTTLAEADPDESMRALLDALDGVAGARVVLTLANADAGGRRVNDIARAYGAARGDRVKVVTSLGQLRYLSLLKLADVVVGNSSSGIIEAPAVGTPTVNIGRRQDGRLRAASIIDCGDSAQEIRDAITTALSAPHRDAVSGPMPYGEGGASARIKQVLKETPLDGLLLKRFHDLPTVPAGVSRTS